MCLIFETSRDLGLRELSLVPGRFVVGIARMPSTPLHCTRTRFHYLMPFTIAHEPDSHLVVVTMSGQLDTKDYEQGLPIIEGYIREFGKLNLLVHMSGFKGWTAGGIWEDIKFDVNHARDFARIALVGESTWQEWAAVICKPFTSGEVRFFSPESEQEAVHWAKTGAETADKS